MGSIIQQTCIISSVPSGCHNRYRQLPVAGLTQLHVDLVHYLKVGMTIDIYGAQTTNLKVQALQITSVDKLNNMIGFSGQVINVNINDEVWISGQFGNLVTLWNTDYPTPQQADLIIIPSGVDENVAVYWLGGK